MHSLSPMFLHNKQRGLEKTEEAKKAMATLNTTMHTYIIVKLNRINAIVHW